MLLSSLILAAGAAVLPSQDGGAPPPTPVRALRAVEQQVVPRHLVTGSLMPAFEARVGARESGAVVTVAARAGRAFSKGDVLVELDTARLTAERAALAAQRAQAAAERTRAEAEDEAAAADLAATEAAAARGALSDRDVRDARARARTARAAVAAAAARITADDAQLALLDVRLADTRVLAPFDGVVVEEMVEVGEWLESGQAVCVLVSTSTFELSLDVPERLLRHSGAFGSDLEVELRATGERVGATGLRTVPRIDAAARSFRVLGDVAADQGVRLGAGMSVSAYLPGGAPRAAVLVPKDALVHRPSGVTVTVVKGADEGGDRLTGAAVSLPVEIAFEVDRAVAIRPGAVQPGDVLVIEGNERLFPGATVSATILPPAGKAAPGEVR